MSETKMRKQYCYEFPRPAVTVDLILFRRRRGKLEVLLVKRNAPPFAGEWALPGGFVDQDEPLEAAAHRELREETGLSSAALEQLGAFGDPGRDPRGHTVAIAFVGTTTRGARPRGGDDASEVRWFELSETPELAFDHAKILHAALRRFKRRDRTVKKSRQKK
jgi:8-oxo-dGTP diphosphatase